MPRAKKNQINPVSEMPVEDFPIQHEPGAHGGLFDRPENSNVIPFTGNDQPVQQNRNTAQIDQFLAQYGIEFI